jgi:hypothetical protein
MNDLTWKNGRRQTAKLTDGRLERDDGQHGKIYVLKFVSNHAEQFGKASDHLRLRRQHQTIYPGGIPEIVRMSMKVAE